MKNNHIRNVSYITIIDKLFSHLSLNLCIPSTHSTFHCSKTRNFSGNGMYMQKLWSETKQLTSKYSIKFCYIIIIYMYIPVCIFHIHNVIVNNTVVVKLAYLCTSLPFHTCECIICCVYNILFISILWWQWHIDINQRMEARATQRARTGEKGAWKSRQ